VAISDTRGFIGRVDLDWAAHRTIDEAEDRLKYTDPSVLWDEKRREDRLREAGFKVVRWSYNDVFYGPEQLLARVSAALRRR
jgi:very-short-patch-repair endonuclease